MKVLYTAFNGKNNSSKILLDKINHLQEDKLYLKNSYITSQKQLIQKIKDNSYDLIISLGQYPRIKNKIRVEIQAKKKLEYKTNFNYETLINRIENNNIKTITSNNAGNYYCNNIYYEGLKYIYENNLKTKMIFLHIPKIQNIDDIELYREIMEKVIG